MCDTQRSVAVRWQTPARDPLRVIGYSDRGPRIGHRLNLTRGANQCGEPVPHSTRQTDVDSFKRVVRYRGVHLDDGPDPRSPFLVSVSGLLPYGHYQPKPKVLLEVRCHQVACVLSVCEDMMRPTPRTARDTTRADRTRSEVVPHAKRETLSVQVDRGGIRRRAAQTHIGIDRTRGV